MFGFYHFPYLIYRQNKNIRQPKKEKPLNNFTA